MATATNPDHYALVVGIDDYPQYRPLKGAVKDAQEFARWLCIEPDGGGLPTDNCKTIYSLADPVSPLQDKIDTKLKEIISSVPKGQQAARLYLYFSGHGMAESSLITDLCLANWSEDFPNRALNAQCYQDALMNLGRFKQVIILLDCCRVRLVAVQGHAPEFVVPAPGRDSPNVRYFLANATEYLAPSYEAATKEKNGETPIVRGYFTRALLAALRGAAAVPTGGVPASKLKNYLEENVPKLAAAEKYQQDPEVVNGLRGDPIFGSAKPSAPEAEPIFAPPPAPPGISGSGRGPGGSPPRFSLILSDSLGAKSVAVINSKNRAVFRGPVRETKKLRLPAGAYNLLTTFAKTTITTPLRLERETKVSTHERLHAVPEFYTSVPLEDAPTSHEYYTGPSQIWSRQTTRTPLPGTADSSLFVFIRAVDRTKAGFNEQLGKGISITDKHGNELSGLSGSAIRKDPTAGWLAFHATAGCGTLHLRFAGEPARELPIYLYPGWQTQVFLMYRDRPLFETLKIFLGRKGRGFEPKAAETRAADIALNGLQSGHDLLTESALKILLYGKFDNPVLGLVGAHVLLHRRQTMQDRLLIERRVPTAAEAKTRRENSRTIALVLHRLNHLLPSSPDVAALRLIAAASQDSLGAGDEQHFEFRDPPLLRRGLQAILVEAARRPQILGTDSVIPEIAPRLYADSPWSTWKPKDETSGIDWVHLAILEAVKKSGSPSHGAGDAKSISPATLAQQLALPQQTVITAAKEMEHMPVEKLTYELPAEYKSLAHELRTTLAPLTSHSKRRARPQVKKVGTRKAGRTGPVGKQSRWRILNKKSQEIALKRRMAAARKARLLRRKKTSKRTRNRAQN